MSFLSLSCRWVLASIKLLLYNYSSGKQVVNVRFCHEGCQANHKNETDAQNNDGSMTISPLSFSGLHQPGRSTNCTHWSLPDSPGFRTSSVLSVTYFLFSFFGNIVSITPFLIKVCYKVKKGEAMFPIKHIEIFFKKAH